jgi:carboxymethylenebutenolidase
MRIGLAFIVSSFLSCVSGSAQEQPKQEAAPKPQQDSGLTGAVSEEEFKALHELKEGESPRLLGAMIDVKDAGKAYLSLPKDREAPRSAVIVIHEWWGLNDHVKHWADRVASLGHAALAIDLYGGKVAKTRDEAMAAMRAVDVEAGKAVVRAAHRFLLTDERVLATKTASLGWCFGGRWSQITAMEVPDLDACVIYYGQPITDAAEVARIKAPVLGIYGSQDTGIPPKLVEEFGAALDDAKVARTFHSYDAPHAFANPSNPRYDEKSAADAFAKVAEFLAAHLADR